MKQLLVSIIIVNWNGTQWLPTCFSSLYSQDYKNFEIIFVDNASKDDSVAWVKKHYPKTKICINDKNLGFADGNNVGYKVAKGSYILFLNNDTRVTKTFLSELIRVVENNPKVGGAQSKILLMDEPKRHDSVGAYLTPTGFLYHFGFGKIDSSTYNKPFILYTAKGACMLFRTSVLRAVAIDGDVFDPAYFAYFEETDMCHRIWLAGYRIVYAYKSVIYHKMGATSSKMDNAFVQYHSFKNRIASYIKNLGAGHLLAILPVHICISELFACVSLFKGKFALYIAIQKALWWNITHGRDIWRLRTLVQHHIRKVPDAAIWHHIMKHPSYKYYMALSRGEFGYEEN